MRRRAALRAAEAKRSDFYLPCNSTTQLRRCATRARGAPPTLIRVVWTRPAAALQDCPSVSPVAATKTSRLGGALHLSGGAGMLKHTAATAIGVARGVTQAAALCRAILPAGAQAWAADGRKGILTLAKPTCGQGKKERDFWARTLPGHTPASCPPPHLAGPSGMCCGASFHSASSLSWRTRFPHPQEGREAEKSHTGGKITCHPYLSCPQNFHTCLHYRKDTPNLSSGREKVPPPLCLTSHLPAMGHHTPTMAEEGMRRRLCPLCPLSEQENCTHYSLQLTRHARQRHHHTLPAGRQWAA